MKVFNGTNNRLRRFLSHLTRETDFLEASGWVRRVRKHKNTTFIELNNGILNKNTQFLMTSDMNPPKINEAVKLTYKREENHLKVFKVEKYLRNDFGIDSSSTVREFEKIQNPNFHILWKLKNALNSFARLWLNIHGYLEIQAPVLSFVDPEGFSELFAIDKGADFFGVPTYLTPSSQFFNELATISHQKIYSYGPVFRAEKHNTTHHLAEFWMLEIEISFIDRLSEMMLIAEKFFKDAIYFFLNSPFPQEILRSIHSHAPSHYMDHLEKLQINQKEPFGRISHDDSCKITKNNSLKISSPEEKFIVEKVFDSRPTFFFDYPAQQKPFYMKLNDDFETVSGFDLIFPDAGEIAGGSMRENRRDILEKRIEKSSLSLDSYRWYIDLCNFGIPRGGFGVGMERLLQYLARTPNIRDGVMIPRFRNT